MNKLVWIVFEKNILGPHEFLYTENGYHRVKMTNVLGKEWTIWASPDCVFFDLKQAQRAQFKSVLSGGC